VIFSTVRFGITPGVGSKRAPKSEQFKRSIGYSQAPILEHPNNQQNIVGRQIGRIRSNRSLTQAMLAARCGVAGWDISRGTLAKIEAGVRCVTDFEFAVLAIALKVPLHELYPAEIASRLKRVT
jgi:DNA-binding XRE family transcriptional regulator